MRGFNGTSSANSPSPVNSAGIRSTNPALEMAPKAIWLTGGRHRF